MFHRTPPMSSYESTRYINPDRLFDFSLPLQSSLPAPFIPSQALTTTSKLTLIKVQMGRKKLPTVQTYRWRHVMEDKPSDLLLFSENLEAVAGLHLDGLLYSKGTAKQISTISDSGKRTTEFLIELDHKHPSIRFISSYEARCVQMHRKQRNFKHRFDRSSSGSLEHFHVSTALNNLAYRSGNSQMIARYRFGPSGTWYMHLTPRPSYAQLSSSNNAQSEHGMENAVEVGANSTGIDINSAGVHVSKSDLDVVSDKDTPTDAAIVNPTRDMNVELDLPESDLRHNDQSVYWKDGTVWNLAIYNNMIRMGDPKIRGTVRTVHSTLGEQVKSYDSENSDID